jgi:hypothetical protein
MSLHCKFGGGKPDYQTKVMGGSAKPSAYAVNGTGRDTYIAHDNGGLYHPYEPSYNPNTGSFLSKHHYENSLATIQPK